MRATPSHLATQLYLRTPPWLFSATQNSAPKKANSPESTVAKCSPYALFLYKNTFFPKKICVCAFFVVPLQPISKESSPDGGIGRRAGLKHQWSNPCRFDPGSGYQRPLNHKLSGLFKKIIFINP